MVKTKYTLDDFRQVLRKYRDFSRKTALFWASILNLKSSEVKCLQIPYRQIPYGGIKLIGKNHWLDFAYLAGGTALALRLGHRQSFDLDFLLRINLTNK